MEKKYEFKDNKRMKSIINSAKTFLEKIKPKDNESEFDINYYIRIYQTSLDLCITEIKADVFIVCLVSLLFDIDNKKFFPDNDDFKNIKIFFNKNNIDKNIQKIIINIITELTNEKETDISYLEGKIVQDSINLDSLGAVGIVKAFMFGGLNNIKIYEPNEEVFDDDETNNSNEDNNNNNNKDNENEYEDDNEYEIENKSENKNIKNNYLSIIGYFYKKLFSLVNKMNTKKGKEMAEDKYKYMLKFLKEFYKENGDEDKIENVEILKQNIINEKIDEYSNQVNKDLLDMINAERKLEENREKIKNVLENKKEKENIENVFKIERAQAAERIQRKKEQCDKMIKNYIEKINKFYEEKEKKLKEEDYLLTKGQF